MYRMTTAKGFSMRIAGLVPRRRRLPPVVGSMSKAGPRLPGGPASSDYKAEDAYGKFLVDLTDRWQLHLLDGGTYPPAAPLAGRFLLRERGEGVPARRDGQATWAWWCPTRCATRSARSGGARRAGRLVPGRARVGRLRAMAYMLPSYTQLGMAALLPGGTMDGRSLRPRT